MLHLVVTCWHDYVQSLNPQTSSLLWFTTTQAALLVTLRSHSQMVYCSLALVDSYIVRMYKIS